jgi:hypothetical protein
MDARPPSGVPVIAAGSRSSSGTKSRAGSSPTALPEQNSAGQRIGQRRGNYYFRIMRTKSGGAFGVWGEGGSVGGFTARAIIRTRSRTPAGSRIPCTDTCRHRCGSAGSAAGSRTSFGPEVTRGYAPPPFAQPSNGRVEDSSSHSSHPSRERASAGRRVRARAREVRRRRWTHSSLTRLHSSSSPVGRDAERAIGCL